MNEKLYKANVKLQDENKLLLEDKKILQKRIDKAIEYIEIGYLSTGEMVNILAQEDLLNILKGVSINE